MLKTHKKAISKLFILFLANMIAGCSFHSVSTNHNPTKTILGTTIGAAAGAGGVALLASQEPVIIGLAGITGAAIGYYLTSMDFSASEIEQAGGKILIQGDCATVALPNYVLFSAGKYKLRPQAHPVLQSTASILNSFPNNDIIISGNSAGFGMYRQDTRLSQVRAQVVAKYLKNYGVSSSYQNNTRLRKIKIIGFGPNFPIANHIRITGIQANNRIQISTCPTNRNVAISEIYSSKYENIGKYSPVCRVELNRNNSFYKAKKKHYYK